MPSGGRLARLIANEIRRRQEQLGLSNREFAEIVGVTHPYLGDRYKYVKDFSLDDIARVSALFSETPLSLIQEAEERARLDAEFDETYALAASEANYDEELEAGQEFP